MKWREIKLSNRQIRTMDRVGGADLILPWPDGLPPGPAPTGDPPEREASPAEHRVAEQIVGPACRAAGLVPIRGMVAMLQRPDGLPRPHETAQHLIVFICGHRWVHASGQPRAAECWSREDRIERVE